MPRSRSEKSAGVEGSAVRDAGPGVPLICPIRDEMAMLPHFLQHYREMGVRRFIFIDTPKPAICAARKVA